MTTQSVCLSIRPSIRRIRYLFVNYVKTTAMDSNIFQHLFYFSGTTHRGDIPTSSTDWIHFTQVVKEF